MEIDINKPYYFNNRPVKIIREEGDNFVFVEAILDITHDLTGSNFCTECNVGPASLSHNCEQAGEIIDAVFEAISDAEVFWVNKMYLREQPFEYKENVTLKNDNRMLSENIRAKKLEVGRLLNNESVLVKSIAQLVKSYKEYWGLKHSLTLQIETLKDKRDKIKEDVRLNRNVKVSGTPVTITADRMLKLLAAEIKLEALETGGVDNWEWYGESLKNTNPQKEAYNEFINL